VASISDEALAALEAHSWPGNIRELENVLERTILFCKGERIELGDLPDDISHKGAAAAAPLAAVVGDESGDLEAPVELAAELSGDTSLKDIVRAETSRVERELIAKALGETGGNVTQAARLLKISRKSLQMKMKELGLRDQEGT
jgi:DNA-binding NtrC family response regulator